MRLANHLALASDHVRAETIEASEFPDLSDEFQIMSVPNTIINNGAGSVIGAVPPARLMKAIQGALA